MKVDCEMLGALLSERRTGELSPEEERSLDAHLERCVRCRSEVRALESLLEAVELPPLGRAELDALATRRIDERPPRRRPVRAGWRVPAVLVAAAAAAVLTLTTRSPGDPSARPMELQTAVAPDAPEDLMPSAESQELFPEMTSADFNAEGADTLDDDAAALEGAGLFGGLDG